MVPVCVGNVSTSGEGT